MLLAVNMPEHDPQVGHAERSICASASSLTEASLAAIIGSMRSSLRTSGLPSRSRVPTSLPASMGPPDTKMVGTLSRIAAINMPGVILSQLEMHISASAQCALTMYSTLSAISSRLGSEYSIPPCPIAMPSSTAMVLNSTPQPPASSMTFLARCPTSCRCTCPGTNCVKLLAIATIGLSKSVSVIPVARQRARAPAMLRPCVEVRLRYPVMAAIVRDSRRTASLAQRTRGRQAIRSRDLSRRRLDRRFRRLRDWMPSPGIGAFLPCREDSPRHLGREPRGQRVLELAQPKVWGPRKDGLSGFRSFYSAASSEAWVSPGPSTRSWMLSATTFQPLIRAARRIRRDRPVPTYRDPQPLGCIADGARASGIGQTLTQTG